MEKGNLSSNVKKMEGYTAKKDNRNMNINKTQILFIYSLPFKLPFSYLIFRLSKALAKRSNICLSNIRNLLAKDFLSNIFCMKCFRTISKTLRKKLS